MQPNEGGGVLPFDQRRLALDRIGNPVNDRLDRGERSLKREGSSPPYTRLLLGWIKAF